MKIVGTLFCRDVKRTMNLRAWLIWIGLAAMGVFFFFASGGRTKLIQNNEIEFMALFLPHMIFGSWAILSVFFDVFSADREHNVMDCIICSGISKTKLFLSKLLTIAVVSFVLAAIYLLPLTAVIVGMSSEGSHIVSLARYLFPLWGYIMVFASLGTFISVLARSSKAALVISLAIGLLFMPRLFVMLIEGIGKIIGWSAETVTHISMIAPGVMMQALSDSSNTDNFLKAAVIFIMSILVFVGLTYKIFVSQDELNYGE